MIEKLGMGIEQLETHSSLPNSLRLSTHWHW